VEDGETNMKKIKLTETELTNIIKKIINESQLLTEDIKCNIYPGGGDSCESGTCLPDPDNNFENCCMKIVNGNNQGCIDGYIQNDDWVEMWSDDWDKSVYSDPDCDCPNGVGRQKRCGGNGCFETGPPGPLGRTAGPMRGRGPFTDRVR